MEGNSPAVRGSLEPCAHSVLTARHSLPIGVRMGLEHLCTRKPRQQRGGCKAELRALRELGGENRKQLCPGAPHPYRTTGLQKVRAGRAAAQLSAWSQ